MTAAPNPPVPTPLRVAVVLLLLEAVALVGAAVLLVVKTLTGSPVNTAGALLGAALALAAAALLAAAARGLSRLNGAYRSPVVVLELLALPVGYSLAFDVDRPGYGAPVLLAALATLFLLFTPPSRAVLDRQFGGGRTDQPKR